MRIIRMIPCGILALFFNFIASSAYAETNVKFLLDWERNTRRPSIA
jgi:hypothetical protein